MSHQVKDLIQCFPDEDEHLMKLCGQKPKAMSVEALLMLMKCSPPMVRQRDGWRCRIAGRDRARDTRQ